MTVEGADLAKTRAASSASVAGPGGEVVVFVMMIEEIEFDAAAELSAAEAGIELQRPGDRP